MMARSLKTLRQSHSFKQSNSAPHRGKEGNATAGEQEKTGAEIYCADIAKCIHNSVAISPKSATVECVLPGVSFNVMDVF